LILASIKYKRVIQNNNLGLPFKKRMMLLFGNLK
jgi:hypothetical protein